MSYTSTDIGLVAGNAGAAAANSTALGNALSAGKQVRLLPGTFYVQCPIRVSAGMPFRLSGEIGATRYDPASLTRLEAVNSGTLLEVGGPDAPNGSFEPAARGVTIEDLQFTRGSGLTVTGLALYQAEQFVVQRCEFQLLDVGLLLQSRELRRCLGGLIQAVQGNGCTTAYKILGEPGQTFGQFTFLSCNADGGSTGWLFDRSGAECLMLGCTVQAQTTAGVKLDHAARVKISGGYHEPAGNGAAPGIVAAGGSQLTLDTGTWGPVECDATSAIQSFSFRRVGGVHLYTRPDALVGKRFDPPTAECWGPPNAPNNALWYPPSGSGASLSAAGHVVRDGQGIEWRCVTAGDNAAQRWQPVGGEVRIPIVGGSPQATGYYVYAPQTDVLLGRIRLVVTSALPDNLTIDLTDNGSTTTLVYDPSRTTTGAVLKLPVIGQHVRARGSWQIAVTGLPSGGAGYLAIEAAAAG